MKIFFFFPFFASIISRVVVKTRLKVTFGIWASGYLAKIWFQTLSHMLLVVFKLIDNNDNNDNNKAISNVETP